MTHDQFLYLRNGEIFVSAIEQFLADMRIEGRALGTIAEYANRLKQYQRYLNKNNLEVFDVKNADILGFRQYLFTERKKSQTIKTILSTLYVFYKWGHKQGLIERVPLSPDDFPKVTNRERIKRLTDDELRVLIAYIDDLQENARAAFWLLIGTGARVGEIAKLTATDVTLEGHVVYIDIKNAKWGSDRHIPVIDERAAKIVWQYRRTVAIDNRPLFHLSKRTIQGYATRFARETGIAFHCHLLRHTFAAKLTENGVPITTIQYLLGHKTVAMTAYYAQSALVDVRSIAPKI